MIPKLPTLYPLEAVKFGVKILNFTLNFSDRGFPHPKFYIVGKLASNFISI